jgi:TRAP-type C4-dicarboxylate transport system permease small subunit
MKWCMTARKGAEVVGVAMYMALVILFVTGVVMRYIVNDPLTWSDELSVILMLWMTFWGAAFVVPEKEHVSFDLVYSLFSPRGQRVIALVSALGFGLLFLASFYPTFDYIAFLWREKTAGLRLSLDKVYFCFTIFVGATAIGLLLKSWRLTRSDWQKWI